MRPKIIPLTFLYEQAFCYVRVAKCPLKYIEDITRWRKDLDFMFERSERVRYCSCHENIKFISSSQRVVFFLLYGKPIQQKQTAGIVTSLKDTTLTKVTYEKYATRMESTSGLVPSKTLSSI